MTTFAFPSVTPNASSLELIANNAVFRSPLSGAVQTVVRAPGYWRLSMNFLNLKGDDKAVMKGFIASLEGQRHRFTVRDHSQVQRGAFGGTPLVKGAGQLGNQITVDGCSNNITNWIRVGDQFLVGGELKMATVDSSSDGSGNITIYFSPSLRNAPADNSAITTTSPAGTFLLLDGDIGWSNRPGDFSDFSIIAIEDIA